MYCMYIKVLGNFEYLCDVFLLVIIIIASKHVLFHDNVV